ncbi:MAG TPA: hypothetical protein PLS25_03010 [Methanoregulaceae archaeon]|nr:hypothetical protein [Methanoregulaceae archaeon]
MAPSFTPRYTCRCGSEVKVTIIRTWVYVTCTNRGCSEFGKQQLPTWGKHKAILPEVAL